MHRNCATEKTNESTIPHNFTSRDIIIQYGETFKEMSEKFTSRNASEKRRNLIFFAILHCTSTEYL